MNGPVSDATMGRFLVTDKTGYGRPDSYYGRERGDQCWSLVFIPFPFIAARHIAMRLRQTVQGWCFDLRAWRGAGGVVCVCQGGGAGQLHLHHGQADHTHLCGAGDLVWGYLNFRRRQAHARCVRTRRHHAAVCGQGGFQTHSGNAHGVLRRWRT